jgi:hypothetical protein
MVYSRLVERNLNCQSDLNTLAIMSRRSIQTAGRAALKSPPTFPIFQKRFAATVLQKPKIVDLSRELYHRCLNHPFHVPFVSPSTLTGPQISPINHSTELTSIYIVDPNTMGHPPTQSRRQRHSPLRLLRPNNERSRRHTRRRFQALRPRRDAYRRNAAGRFLHFCNRTGSLARGIESFDLSGRNGGSTDKIGRGD